MPVRVLLISLACLIVIGLLKPAVNAAPDSVPLLYTVASAYDALAWMHGGERFPSGATLFLRNEKGEHPLLAGFAATADAAVSFDGQRVLFAGKQHEQDPWQIWELAASGKTRRITSGSENCIRPFYLPEDRIVYARKMDGRFVIEAMNLSGGKPLALTYSVGNFLPDDVLRDGRILFDASTASSDGTPEIYTVYSDGSGVESYRCDHGAARHRARQISSGEIVFPSGRGLAKFTSARAQQVNIPAPAGEYAGEIAESAAGEWVLSWRAGEDHPYQLMLWKFGESTLRQVVERPNANVLQPVLLEERKVPNLHPSGLHDWPNANLLCLNAYTSKHGFAPGSIHAMRLYTRDGSGAVTLLGTAPVEPDGSFFIHVPSEQPLQIALLDEAGRTLHRESGFFWMRRGEQRECVGCHAGPETAPENAVPMTLLNSTTPADLTGASTQRAAGGTK